MRLEKLPEQIRLIGPHWVFEFQRVADRWQHTVLWKQGPEFLPVLQSAEGTPTGEHLPSPAFQDLLLEPLAGDDCEFQVMGQSGQGIYTAAIRYDATDGALDFDVCARGKKGLESLCLTSTYLLPREQRAPISVEPEESVVALPERNLTLKLAPVPIAGVPVAKCRRVTEAGQAGLAIGHFATAEIGGGSRQISVRWRYRLSVLSGPLISAD
ncbi:MAG: hypothetical protein JSS02_22945 [Planctomycetes bacterium]|nr:hypothetical protein [Planctomycetota bacterium]